MSFLSSGSSIKNFPSFNIDFLLVTEPSLISASSFNFFFLLGSKFSSSDFLSSFFALLTILLIDIFNVFLFFAFSPLFLFFWAFSSSSSSLLSFIFFFFESFLSLVSSCTSFLSLLLLFFVDDFFDLSFDLSFVEDVTFSDFLSFFDDFFEFFIHGIKFADVFMINNRGNLHMGNVNFEQIFNALDCLFI